MIWASGAHAPWGWITPVGRGLPRFWCIAREQVSFRPDGFTLTQPGATLQATFISPAPLQIGLTDKVISYVPAGDNITKPESVPLRAIHATHAQDDKQGHFLVVLTLQRNQPPAVTAQGQGLKARIQVGKQTVRFDGTSVIFE